MNDTSRNRLEAESSPYLRQHASNPVHWYPWVPEAFAEAKSRNVPVLLSIGYAACHWCHVMAHESFEDNSIAAQMNAQFVCVKVDREERPDIDAVYMKVTQALNDGHGGWPMTLFLTPDAQPFFAGTYFPAREKEGRVGFDALMQHLATQFKDNEANVRREARAITMHLAADEAPQNIAVSEISSLSEMKQSAFQTLTHRFDSVDGGFGGAPKFPPTAQLRFLLERFTQEHDPTARLMVEATLDAMAKGGFWDGVGGGFCRYATDRAWRVPHFEKMLYDNALLASIYLEAAKALHVPRYLKVATQTLDFVIRELRHDDGGFMTSLDADTEGHEGRFYTFTYQELELALGPDDAKQAAPLLNCHQDGNWEAGQNIITFTGAAKDRDLLDTTCASLYQFRKKRVAPAQDSKVIVGHNGLMIFALAQAADALPDSRYLTYALETAETVWTRAHLATGQLLRLASQSARPLDGVLEDYAYLALGLSKLFISTGDALWRTRAESLLTYIIVHFVDASSGALVMTADSSESLLFRPSEAHDAATPGAQAISILAYRALQKHAPSHSPDARWERAAKELTRACAKHPVAFCQALVSLSS